MVSIVSQAAFSLLRYMATMAQEVHIEHHQIHSSKFEGTAKLLFISDIHRRTVPLKLLRKLATNYDAVLVGGDFTEDGVPLERTERNIKRLSTLGPLYYVFGNNDREVGENKLLNLLETNGVTILCNDSVRLSTVPVQIIGIDDVHTGKVDIDKAFETTDASMYTVFMTHSPAYFTKLATDKPVDLVVAGHHHGGQIRFLNWGLQPLGKLVKTKIVTSLFQTVSERPHCLCG